MPSSRTAVSDSERKFKILLFGLSAGTVILLLLWAIDVTNKERFPLQRWLPFLSKNPEMGESVFRDKGCIHCHAIHQVGGTSAPDLGIRESHGSSLAQLVSAMWNHAPQMWKAMQADQLSYPELTYDQTSELVSFLYMSGHIDAPGNAERGRELFHEKACSRCHAIRGQGGRTARDLAGLPVNSASDWAQAMLNASGEMRASMEDLGMSWPRFAARDLNDLFAYFRQINPVPANSALPASTQSPARHRDDANAGWEVFQAKSCLVCHSVKDEHGRLGPSLGPSANVAGTFSDMAARMWNAMPKMEGAMSARHVASPHFINNELGDLLAFLYTLRYFEPTGSPQLGQSVFRSRGCARCHGDDGQGGVGPALRGRTHLYNSISLAAQLWTHGRKMFDKSQETQQAWPVLQESDIGDLLTFLNQPVTKRIQ